jgi:hypothetical protein
MVSIQLAPITAIPIYNWKESTFTTTRLQVEQSNQQLEQIVDSFIFIVSNVENN